MPIITFKDTEENFKEAIRRVAFAAGHSNSSKVIQETLRSNEAIQKELQKIAKKKVVNKFGNTIIRYYLSGMVIKYIYCLIVRGKIVYVGVSVNPARRLVQHYQTQSGSLRKTVDSVTSISEIHIGILEVVRADSLKMNQDVSQREFYWINKFLLDGHELANTVIKRSSLLSLKYHKNNK